MHMYFRNALGVRVGIILTARDFPCGKSRDGKYPKNLGNTRKYFIKKIYHIFLRFFSVKRMFLNFLAFIMLLYPLRFAIK